jgi:predicted metal-dependent hydrolase
MNFFGVMLLKMTEQQYKRWMIAKTRQYIWLVLHKDPNNIKISFSRSKQFTRSFKRCHGACSRELQQIYYRTDFINNGWDCDFKTLENLVIHEVCHLKHDEHDGAFFNEYKRWSGDDFIDRWHRSGFDVSLRDDDGRYVSHVVGLPTGQFIGCE